MPLPDRHRIAVVSQDERGLGRLLEALGAALGVRFVSRRAGEWRDIEAAIILGGDLRASEAAAATGVPTLVSLGRSKTERGVVILGDDEGLDPRLRGASLTDDCGAGDPVPTLDGDIVLASCNGNPRWTRRTGAAANLELVALPLEPLGNNELLRDALEAGRFLSLLPVVHFLRRVTLDHGWVGPPLRAAFMFDDPNLHWPSYGHVRYKQLSGEAERQRFHAAMAMIPLDGRFAHPSAARTFREASEYLSLVVHGNDHIRGEMKRPFEVDALKVAGQALRRVAAFERRYGVPVSRVMVPPHGACSPASHSALSRLGFEAICGTRKIPGDRTGLAEWPLAKWEPGEFVTGGLPLFTRHSMQEGHEDLVLRAYLAQPLLIYGHHEDLAHGLDVLSEFAATIRTVGPARWTSLTDIARSSFATKREGGVLAVRLFSRRVSIPVPEGIESIRVELPDSTRHIPWTGVRCGGSRMALSSKGTRSTDPFRVQSANTVHLVAEVQGAVEPDEVLRSRTAVWPIVRRALTESRDRLAPFARVLNRP